MKTYCCACMEVRCVGVCLEQENEQHIAAEDERRVWGDHRTHRQRFRDQLREQGVDSEALS